MLAAASNRRADAETIHARLLELLDGQRLAYRQLDSAPFDPTWILGDFLVP